MYIEQFARFTEKPAVATGSGLFDRQGVERPTNWKHGKKKTPAYRYIRACGRCGGMGGSDKWKHTGWTCYRCGGKGYDPNPAVMPLYTRDQLDKLNVRKAKADAKRAAAAEAKRIEREAADAKARDERAEALKSNPFFQALRKWAMVDDNGESTDSASAFLAEMVDTMRVRELSEKQAEAAQKIIDRKEEEARQRRECAHIGEVGKRVALSGVVVFALCIYRAEPFTGERDRYLLKFKTDDGHFFVWKTSRNPKIGTRFTGKATVTAHDWYKGIPQTTVKNFREAKAKE